MTTKTTDTIAIRVDPKLKKRLDKLAKASKRSMSFLAQEAIEQYVDTQSWQIDGVVQAQEMAMGGAFASHEDVARWLKSWGAAKEQTKPEPTIKFD